MSRANSYRFYSGGSAPIELTGDMVASDLLAGKTGYADDPETKITGTLTLLDTSDATADTHSLALDETAYVNGVKITGVAKGYSLTNMITNGNFVSDYTGWTTNGGSLSVANGILSYTANAQWKTAIQTITAYNGHKYYWGGLAKGAVTGFIGYTGTAPALSNDTEMTRYSGVQDYAAAAMNFGIGDASASGFAPIYLDNFVVIDLTATFGAGNEWTAAQMDALLAAKYPADSYFNGTVNIVY